MAFKLSLAKRRRAVKSNSRRYHENPAYRLAVINRARAQRGAVPIASLDEMGDPKRGRVGAGRDAKGRFV